MSANKSAAEVKEAFIEGYPDGSGELAHWLWNDISNLHMNWTNYRILFGTDEAIIDLLNSVASSFFAIVERVLRHDSVLRICRITDPPFFGRSKRNSNASLRQLSFRTENDLPEELQDEFAKQLNKLDELADPIRTLRDKRIAHSDSGVVLEYSSEPLGVSRAAVEDILSKIRGAFHLLEDHYLGSVTSFEHVIQANDARKLLYHLRQVRTFEEIERVVLNAKLGR